MAEYVADEEQVRAIRCIRGLVMLVSVIPDDALGCSLLAIKLYSGPKTLRLCRRARCICCSVGRRQPGIRAKLSRANE